MTRSSKMCLVNQMLKSIVNKTLYCQHCIFNRDIIAMFFTTSTASSKLPKKVQCSPTKMSIIIHNMEVSKLSEQTREDKMSA
jgi:hypothetical protein